MVTLLYAALGVMVSGRGGASSSVKVSNSG